MKRIETFVHGLVNGYVYKERAERDFIVMSLAPLCSLTNTNPDISIYPT